MQWPPDRVEEILNLPSWLEGSDGTDEGRSSAQSGSDGGDETSLVKGDAAVEELEKELREVDVNDKEEREELHREVLNAASNADGNGDIDAGDGEGETREDGEDIMDAIESDIAMVKRSSDDSFSDRIDDETSASETMKEAADEEFKEQISTAADTEQSESDTSNHKPAPTPQSAPSKTDRRLSNIDAAVMEPMHPSIITALHGLCSILSSESKTPKMSEMALECITLLTNQRYVSGVAGGRMKLETQRKLSESTIATSTTTSTSTTNTTPGHDGRDGTLSFLGYVVESITRASESPSEQVQISMARTLLAIMTCPKCGVHEAAMLQAVRSTFHVYLVGKTEKGKEGAKRIMVDMLKCVFNRMEAYNVMNQKKRPENDEEENVMVLTPVPSGEDDATESTVRTNGTSASQLENGSSLSSSPARNRIEASSSTIGAFASQYHTDSYLLFRALCKLSSKTLPGDENVMTSTPASAMGANFFSAAPPVDPLALNSKILSLELILAVFEHCGDAFRNGEKFIYAVQSYLCVSLLKNCMSNQTSVAHLSLKIFLLLVKKFKTHLKSEIEVFVANIFLRVLESPNSPFEQKVLVLEALRALCADPQMLTQLFLNYDCDFDAVNLYKDIVHHVTRISAKACAPTNPATVTKKNLDQETDLSRTGLEVLVVILRSFLKALDLPGGDDVFDENDGSSSLSLLRRNLKLDITNESDFDDKITNRNNQYADAMSEKVDNDHELKREGSSSGFAEKIVDAFDKKRTAEQNFEIGMVKFTLSLKSGLSFFIDSGFVQLDARDMARFLYENAERLDKTQTGEVLGKETDASFVKDPEATAEKGGKGFFLRVLHHYVDFINFEGLLFDDAIRLFLSGFRLPGEAQKVRIRHAHDIIVSLLHG